MFFFSYDRDVNFLFRQARRKLKCISEITHKDLFDSLIYPIHWNKYSHQIKEYVIGEVRLKLLTKNVALLDYTKDKNLFFVSKMQKDRIYYSRHTL